MRDARRTWGEIAKVNKQKKKKKRLNELLIPLGPFSRLFPIVLKGV